MWIEARLAKLDEGLPSAIPGTVRGLMREYFASGVLEAVNALGVAGTAGRDEEEENEMDEGME